MSLDGYRGFGIFGKVSMPMPEMTCIPIVLWLVSLWMYRPEIF